jgi:hypothetical protein
MVLGFQPQDRGMRYVVNLKCIKHIHRIVFILALLFCMGATAALADSATFAEVNGVKLTAANPYWKNGNLPASETDWNAWFDTSTPTPTLWLENAIINTLNTDERLIYADDDLVLALDGTNTLVCPSGNYFEIACIEVYGDLTIRDGSVDGTGRMDISMEPGPYTYEEAYGILTFTDLIIESGTIDISIERAIDVYGLLANFGGVYIHGGDTNIEAEGIIADGVVCYTFNMTGGTIEAHTNGYSAFESALAFLDVLVTGGEGVFIEEGGGSGGLWEWPGGGSFRVLDGRMIFASVNHEALVFYTAETVIPEVNGRILVSTDPTGAGKFLWDSSKGMLAGNDMGYSEFRYVELVGGGLEQPATGDESRPWLWFGIGLIVMLAAGAVFFLHQKRNIVGLKITRIIRREN